MKAISLHQPWGSLMSTGAKTIETRSWPTKYRGPIVICAAKRKVRGELLGLLHDKPIRNGLKALKRFWLPSIEIDDLPFGKAVAVGDLVDCITTDEVTMEQLKREGLFGDYTRGRFAWIFKNLKRIKEPFPVTGKQGFFDVELPENVRFVEIMSNGKEYKD